MTICKGCKASLKIVSTENVFPRARRITMAAYCHYLLHDKEINVVKKVLICQEESVNCAQVETRQRIPEIRAARPCFGGMNSNCLLGHSVIIAS